MNRNYKIQNNVKGFTVIELLIATVIFSIVLLVLTQTIISITNNYYHGVIQTQTEQVVKNINNDIVQQIQFATSDSIVSEPPKNNWPSSGTLTTSTPNMIGFSTTNPNNSYEGYLCIGSNEYIYQKNGIVKQSSPNNDHQAYGSLVLTFDSGCKNPGPTMGSLVKTWNFSKNQFIPNAGNTALKLIPNNMRLVKLDVTKVLGFQNLYKVDVKVAYGQDGTTIGTGYDASNYVCFAKSYYCATSELVTYVEKTQ
jgi:prepilin-type N-terminal cleavage/methylation domain-containing protein